MKEWKLIYSFNLSSAHTEHIQIYLQNLTVYESYVMRTNLIYRHRYVCICEYS